MVPAAGQNCSDSCDTCRDVVLRTYLGFRDCGGDDRTAFRVAVRVLALRHPGLAREDCITLAAEWLGEPPQA